jgi:DNA-binding protein HU-beta
VNKSDLISDVAKNADVTKVEAEKVIDAVFVSITNALVENDEVRLIGFGTFAVSERAATEGRNPRTGQKIAIPARRVPKFRPGKQLKDAVEAKKPLKRS